MPESRFRCVSCRSFEAPHGLEFSSHEPVCPRCKQSMVLTLVDIHLYVPDPQGPIVGEHNRRFRVACKPQATNPHGKPCTGEAKVATCPACRATKEWQELHELQNAVAGGEIL